MFEKIAADLGPSEPALLERLEYLFFAQKRFAKMVEASHVHARKCPTSVVQVEVGSKQGLPHISSVPCRFGKKMLARCPHWVWTAPHKGNISYQKGLNGTRLMTYRGNCRQVFAVFYVFFFFFIFRLLLGNSEFGEAHLFLYFFRICLAVFPFSCACH